MKKFVFWVLLGFLVLILAETGGYVAWSIYMRQIVGPVQIQKIIFSSDHTRDNVVNTEQANALDELMPGYGLKDKYIHPYLGYVVQGAVNDLWNIQDDENSLCVLLTGGSVARGLIRSREYLRDRLVEKFPQYEKVDVHHLAAPGFKQPQQLMQLNYLLSLGKRCDILINLDGYNEATITFQNVNNDVLYSYPDYHSWTKLVGNLKSPSEMMKMYEIIQLVQARTGWADRIKKSKIRYSSVISLWWYTRDILYSQRHVALQKELSPKSETNIRNLASHGRENPSYIKNENRYEHMANLWAESSRLMQTIAEANDIQYFHFLQTGIYLTDARPMRHPDENNFPQDNDVGFQERLKGVYARFPDHFASLVNAGIHFQDLTEIFAGVPDHIFTDAVHITDLGNRIYIDHIIDYVYTVMNEENK